MSEKYSDEFSNELIEGRNAIIEAIRAQKPIDKIYCAKGDTDNTLGFIASKARSKGIAVVQCDRRKLDAMSVTKAHQGVIAVCSVQSYCSVNEILSDALSSEEQPLIIVCDEISDPHNLGAIIRTAECVGAHGVIIPKRRSAGLTAIVDKASAGAAEHMKVARVANLVSTIKELKSKGLWVYGAAAGGQSSLWSTDFKGPVALVVGSEGNGISPLLKKNCDFIVDIPMYGNIDSLNASVAASVLMYEITRQRKTL